MNTLARKEKKLSLSALLFLIYWVVKSFYTKDSGGLQIGDYIFALSFVAFFVETVMVKGVGVVCEKDKELLTFVFCVLMINLIYSVLLSDSEFLLPILYFIFNFCIVVEFRSLAKNKNFLKWFFIATFICIAMQLFVFIIGAGEWYAGKKDLGRYMGTFNDPNQLAFFVMSRFFILYVMFNHIQKKTKMIKLITFIAFVMTFVLVVESASTGMLLGLTVFAVVWLVTKCFISRNVVLNVFVLLAFVLLVFIITGGDRLIFTGSNNFISTRLEEKLFKLSSDGGFIKDRNLGAFFAKPYYILFGAGEGGWGRFIDVASLGELHSSVLGLLFYYGIIPFIILIIWVVKNLRNAKKMDFCVYIAILVEMFTLINHRQASLWILFILPSIFIVMEKNNG